MNSLFCTIQTAVITFILLLPIGSSNDSYTPFVILQNGIQFGIAVCILRDHFSINVGEFAIIIGIVIVINTVIYELPADHFSVTGIFGGTILGNFIVNHMILSKETLSSGKKSYYMISKIYGSRNK